MTLKGPWFTALHGDTVRLATVLRRLLDSLEETGRADEALIDQADQVLTEVCEGDARIAQAVLEA